MASCSTLEIRCKLPTPETPLIEQLVSFLCLRSWRASAGIPSPLVANCKFAESISMSAVSVFATSTVADSALVNDLIAGQNADLIRRNGALCAGLMTLLRRLFSPRVRYERSNHEERCDGFYVEIHGLGFSFCRHRSAVDCLGGNIL